ncbi:hypothetical protein [Gimesia aquarii]|uniref:Uncharacterized protein n=1 Tax=Gimesia aquarii TaxID=2527964 RepID=A0A517WT26_9PLAN|nr:hypothetical protein [Gimesia aquarii]QDU08404.1 hypothetical protein V202x_17720 [Gimesia aquarii]
MIFLSFVRLTRLYVLRLQVIFTNGVKQVSKTYAPYCLDYGPIAQNRIVKIEKWYLKHGNQSLKSGEDQKPVLPVYTRTIKNALFLIVTESAGTQVFTHQNFSLARATQMSEFRNPHRRVKLQKSSLITKQN